MERVVIAAVLVVLAVVVAVVVDRRRTVTPLSIQRGAVPTRVRPADVGLPDAPAIVVFTEATCQSCQAAIRLVRGPAGAELPVADIEYGQDRHTHETYGIDTVPTTVVVHADGTVAGGWTGKVDPGDLAIALAAVVDRDENPEA